MKDNFRRKIMIKIGVGLMIVLSLVAVLFILGSQISAQAEYIYSTRTALNARLNSINQLSQLKSVAAEVQPYMVKLNQALPKKDALLFLSRDLENIARQYNLSYGFKFVGEDASEQNLRSQKFQLSVQGRYQDVTAFIKALETGTYFISIADVDIIGSGESYNGAINGQVFFNG